MSNRAINILVICVVLTGGFLESIGHEGFGGVGVDIGICRFFDLVCPTEGGKEDGV